MESDGNAVLKFFLDTFPLLRCEPKENCEPYGKNHPNSISEIKHSTVTWWEGKNGQETN